MKKRIIICVTCIAVAGIYVDAQTKTVTTATESFVAIPPAPPAPPLPPLPPVPPSTDGIDRPLPPAPPLPPLPPVPPVITAGYDNTEMIVPEIINSNGNEISVRSINGKDMVIIKKDGKTQQIKLSTWNADRKYYEKKFGQLPPPPPIPDEIKFTPPVIKTDGQ